MLNRIQGTVFGAVVVVLALLSQATPLDVDGDELVGPQEVIDLAENWKGPTLQQGGVQPWQVDGTSIFYNGGNVGIGTSAPGERLTIAGDAELGASHGDYRRFRIGGGNSSGFLYGSYPRYGDGIHMGYNYYADAGGADRVIQPDGATSRLTVGYGFAAIATGGIGQPPLDRVVVDSVGNLRLGANTQLFAPGGEENLRIVRGTLDGSGGILAGTGFTTYTLGSGGQIRVNFNTPFAGLPTITSSPGLGASSSQVFYTSPGQIELRTYSGGGNLVAAGVHFIAVGPR